MAHSAAAAELNSGIARRLRASTLAQRAAHSPGHLQSESVGASVQPRASSSHRCDQAASDLPHHPPEQQQQFRHQRRRHHSALSARGRKRSATVAVRAAHSHVHKRRSTCGSVGTSVSVSVATTRPTITRPSSSATSADNNTSTTQASSDHISDAVVTRATQSRGSGRRRSVSSDTLPSSVARASSSAAALASTSHERDVDASVSDVASVSGRVVTSSSVGNSSSRTRSLNQQRCSDTEAVGGRATRRRFSTAATGTSTSTSAGTSAVASGSGVHSADTTGSCTSTHSGRRGSRSGSGGTGTGGAASGGVKLAALEPATSVGVATTSSSSSSSSTATGAATTASSATAGPSTAAAAAGGGSEEESDMGRLQALLEARGIPPHLLGALGPRMQQMLHRTMGSSSRMQQLVQMVSAPVSGGDETQQLQAVIELGQLLVMGNEETLAGFPVKQVVPPLVRLLQMEHNFDMMNHACRALTYLMEALPRSTSVVVEAVPTLLQKLQSIQCMDVAEQALSALELISRRHGKHILQVGGISSCLVYIDFFSITAQRAALSITANCCVSLTVGDFALIQPNIPALAQRISHQDKKTVESVCAAFSRLVDTFKYHPAKMNEIASPTLLCNLQQLLLSSPSLVSSSTFCELLRMLRVVCTRCPSLAARLVATDHIVDTLCSLLVSNKDQMDLVSRSADELFALVGVIGELLPALPTDGVFAIDQWLLNIAPREVVQWMWKDEADVWRNFSQTDNYTIECANQAGADTVQLQTVTGWQFTVDLVNMIQVNNSDSSNSDSNNSDIQCAVRRHSVAFHQASTSSQQASDEQQLSTSSSSSSSPAAAAGGVAAVVSLQQVEEDPRLVALQQDTQLFSHVVGLLFPVLYKVYSSCAGPAVRHACLRAILRMIFHTPTDIVKELVSLQEVSSHLTGMLSSGDVKVQVVAIQLADVLLHKLPEQCSVHFRREGVVYQINQLTRSAASCHPAAAVASSSVAAGHVGGAGLCGSGGSSASLPSYLDVAVQQNTSPHTSSALTASTQPSAAAPAQASHELDVGASLQASSDLTPQQQQQQQNIASSSPSSSATAAANSSTSSSNILSEVLKRKRTCKRLAPTTSRRSRHEARSSATSTASSAIDTLSRGRSSTGSASSSSVMSQLRGRFVATTSSSLSSPSTSSSSSSSFSSSMSAAVASTSAAAGGAGRFQSTFLASFNPARWSRPSHGSSNGSPGPLPLATSASTGDVLSRGGAATGSVSVACGQRERVRVWLRQRASVLVRRRLNGDTSGSTTAMLQLATALDSLRQACTMTAGDDVSSDTASQHLIEPLKQISAVVCQSDISPFEILQSGLVATLTDFLTAANPGITTATSTTAKSAPADSSHAVHTPLFYDRLRAFLHVFAGCPVAVTEQEWRPTVTALSGLVFKLQACVSQTEQLLVKIHDVSAGGGGGSGHSALRYFNQNQLKCNLYRWPSCTSVRQWRGGPVKIDPLALVQAIERYLVIRGYGRQRGEQQDEDASDDVDSDDDIEDTMAAVSISQGRGHKLQFVINGHVVPYNMTVFQAVQQFSSGSAGGGAVDLFENDAEHTVGSTQLFQHTHTIYYRPAPDEDQNGGSGSGVSGCVGGSVSSRAHMASSSSTGSAEQAGSAGKRNRSAASSSCGKAVGRGGRRRGGTADLLWTEGVVSERVCPLRRLLLSQLPSSIVTVTDPCLPTLNLLRVLHALSRHHGVLYRLSHYSPLLPMQEFINSKVAAKTSRQLQDPLIVMTGNAPKWLYQIGITCPFLLPFETRQLLFYTSTFDRDRALMRLMDASPELQAADGDERIAPRLERKKRQVSRADLLRQAEFLMSELAGSRALLEVQYAGEVGSGLGPTLEFYSQVSRELQRCDLALWRGESNNTAGISSTNTVKTDSPDKSTFVAAASDSAATTASTSTSAPAALTDEYVSAPFGLYPLPLAKNCKAAVLSRVKAKYKFLGKLMAKALMDSRLLDLPLNEAFFKWLLREEHSLSSCDLHRLDPLVGSTVAKLQAVVERQLSATTANWSAEQLETALTVDGCPVADLALEFTLPGHANIELYRGGRDRPVTVHNLQQYIQLLLHWLLYEGVHRQMEAFREGFESVCSLDNLAMFFPEEMNQLFCGAQDECWQEAVLRETFRSDHGYTHDSPAFNNLISILAQYDRQQRRCFLSFVTGSPRLPVGGFRALSPPLTVVRKTVGCSERADDLLPSVMTCVNYLKLPDYSSRAVMSGRLDTAVNEGRLSFMLS